MQVSSVLLVSSTTISGPTTDSSVRPKEEQAITSGPSSEAAPYAAAPSELNAQQGVRVIDSLDADHDVQVVVQGYEGNDTLLVMPESV